MGIRRLGPKPPNRKSEGRGLESSAAHKRRLMGHESGCGSSQARFPNSQLPGGAFPGGGAAPSEKLPLCKNKQAKRITSTSLSLHALTLVPRVGGRHGFPIPIHGFPAHKGRLMRHESGCGSAQARFPNSRPWFPNSQGANPQLPNPQGGKYMRSWELGWW